MRFFAALSLALILSAAGCRSKPNPLTGEPMPAQGPADVAINAANESVWQLSNSYVILTEGLEYIGDKVEDTSEFLGDIYESL